MGEPAVSFTRTSFADFVVSAQSNDCTDKQARTPRTQRRTDKLGSLGSTFKLPSGKRGWGGVAANLHTLLSFD